MTLLSICTDALEEITGFDVPTSFVGNSNPTAVSMLAAVKVSGNGLEMLHDWENLISENTFSTVASTASYSRPADFRKFANMTVWDRSNFLQVEGPVSPAQWHFFKGSITGSSATITNWFRIKGDLIFLHPTPTSINTIAYDYYSKNWITQASDSSNVRAFEADADTLRLDEDLVKLNAKWRFLQSKGLDWEVEYRDFEDMLDHLKAQDGGLGVLRMDKDFRHFATRLPEGNFLL